MTARHIFCMIIALLIFTGFGCSSRDDINLKVAVTDFYNRTAHKEETIKTFFEKRLLIEIADECDELIVLDPYLQEFPEALKELPIKTSGFLDNLAISNIARSNGLNAVITGSFISIDLAQEERGYFWFKDMHVFVKVLVNIEMFDPVTAAKILDNSYLEEVKIDEFEIDSMVGQKVASLPQLNKAMEKIATDIAEDICEVLQDIPWRGTIASSAGNTVTISTGVGAGLKEGDRLTVLARGREYTGQGGHVFIIPGSKLGELRVTRTFAHSAEAEITDGENIPAGSNVMLYDD